MPRTNTHSHARRARNNVRIVVVDDNPTARSGIEIELKGYGYTNVSSVYPIVLGDERIRSAEIVIVDIKGVHFGVDKPFVEEYSGLSVAAALKSTYPWLKVISYTGNLADFKGNFVLESVVDGKFDKSSDQKAIMSEVDGCIAKLYNPTLFWRDLRTQLLKKDIRISKISKIESGFVRRLIHKTVWELRDLSAAYRKAAPLSESAKFMADQFDDLAKAVK